MNVARPAAPAILALAAACAAWSGSAGLLRALPSRVLRVRAPDLSRPVSERLPDPSLPADRVKAAVLARINEDRARFGLAAVLWDEAASRVSDAFCARQIEERTRGHFLMDGLPPYARTGFAGIFGVHSENSVSWVTTAKSFQESTIELALTGQEQMMDEKPPADGHRQTILDPEATHVGVGYSIAHGRFQMSQEFLTRRLERLTLSSLDSRSGAVSISGKAAPGWRFRFVTVGREDPPRPLTREQATSRSSYSYPKGEQAFIPEGLRGVSVVGTTTDDRVRTLPGQEFVFPFAADRPGLYTFQIYLARSESDRPRPGGGATIWVE
jgi:hypothetical protein